jgi:hypothetical protein
VVIRRVIEPITAAQDAGLDRLGRCGPALGDHVPGGSDERATE